MIASEVARLGEGLGLAPVEGTTLAVGALELDDPPQLTRTTVAMTSQIRTSIQRAIASPVTAALTQSIEWRKNYGEHGASPITLEQQLALMPAYEELLYEPVREGLGTQPPRAGSLRERNCSHALPAATVPDQLSDSAPTCSIRAKRRSEQGHVIFFEERRDDRMIWMRTP